MDNKTKAHLLGETIAKLYFESNDYYVYTNSSGKSEYDLVLSKDNILYAVEVKTTTTMRNGKAEVQLKAVRSNKNGNVIKNFDNSILDFLVIVDIINYKILVLNAEDITVKCQLTVYEKDFISLEATAG